MCFSVYAVTGINNLLLFVLYTGIYRVDQKVHSKFLLLSFIGMNGQKFIQQNIYYLIII